MSESSCPFCQRSLGEEFQSSATPKAPAGRLTRAALLAFGTTAVATQLACSSPASPAGPEDAGNNGQDVGPMMDAAYGMPPVRLDGGADASEDAHMMSYDAYGLPPFDSGTDANDASASDAATDAGEDAHDAGPMLDAAYGHPPFDSGTHD